LPRLALDPCVKWEPWDRRAVRIKSSERLLTRQSLSVARHMPMIEPCVKGTVKMSACGALS